MFPAGREISAAGKSENDEKFSGTGARADETGIVFCDDPGDYLQPDSDIISGIL